MSTTLQSTLTDILQKISRLEEEQERLFDRCRQLEREKAELQSELKDKSQELDRTRLEVEYLRVSYRLAGDADSIIEARRKISSIIRRIDRAISLATDDPSL